MLNLDYHGCQSQPVFIILCFTSLAFVFFFPTKSISIKIEHQHAVESDIVDWKFKMVGSLKHFDRVFNTEIDETIEI